jgi:hypothetical protein
MTETAPALLGVFVFILVLSLWNFFTNQMPASVGTGAHWIALLVAAIMGIGVYLQYTRN